MITLRIPLRTVNELNDHSYWRVRQKRAKQQHAVVALSLAIHRKPALPCVVTFSRVSPGTLDSDGHVASMKFCRDAVAKWLGVDDKHDDLVQYVYGPQIKGARGEYAVLVSIESKEARQAG